MSAETIQKRVILFDSNGVAMAVENGIAIPAGTQSLLTSGSDGTNSRVILVDSSGRQIIKGDGTAGTPDTGVVTIQGIASGTAISVSSSFANLLGQQKIVDGTDGTTAATVKAASTAAVAADKALVVSVSPNNRVATTITSPLGALAGLYAYVSAYGTLRVTNEGPGLFNDSFDGVVIDVTNRWTTTLFTGGTLTQATGRVTSTVSTVASRGTSQVSIPTFDHQGLSFTLFGVVVQLEVAAITNNHRFWGVGTSSAFTAATPLTDAVGFEVGTDGILYACVYAAGTKTFSQALTKPTDGAFHRYAVVYRGDLVIWYQDGVEIPVASASFFNPDVFTLPIRFHNINHTTPPGSAPTFVIGAVGMSSSAPENTRISDGLYPWRKATVKPASVVAVAADPALVVDARKPATGALANVAGSASSVTLIGANTGRLGATIFNDSTAILYVKFGTTASLTSFTVRMIANAYYEVPFGYTGLITGIWASATGNARCTELT